MLKIESGVAAQVADTARPAQSAQDRSLQSRQAATSEMAGGTKPVSADDVRAAAASIKQVVEAASGRQVGFDVHEVSDEAKNSELVLTVTDTETGEVVKQIPGDEVLKMRDRLHEMIGLFFSKQA
jgi:flagellar protein FlaG